MWEGTAAVSIFWQSAAGAARGSGSFCGPGISAGNGLGNGSQYFCRPSGPGGNSDLRGGNFPAVFLLSSSFWMGSSVDHVWRKEPEKIFLPDSGRIFFPVIWDRDGSRRQSAYFAAGSQKNILKLLKFQPFSAILVPQRTQRDIENVRADRKFPERGIFLQTRACYGL